MTMRSMRAGAAGLALAVLALTAGTTQAAAEPAAITTVGADLVSVALDGDALSLRIRDAAQVARDVPGHDPAEVILGPEGGLAGRVPPGKAFAFLGPAGQPVWSLSAGDTGFPALDTTGVRPDALADATVTLTLGNIEGPGTFTAYTLSGLGTASPLFGSGATVTRSVKLPAATRTAGVVWAFDAAGDYRLTLAASAALRSGGTVNAEATYRIRVPAIVPAGQVPPPAAPQRTTPDEQPTARTFAAPAEAKPAAAPTPAAAPPPAAKAATTAAGARQVIADGHVDMGPQLAGDAWTIRIKDDRTSPAVWRETADVVLQVKDNAKITVPAGAEFLGKQGDTVWLLPQSQQAGIVWPGWNTQHPSVVSGIKGTVTWTLKGVTGPGRYALFLTGSFGKADVLFDSAKPFPQQLSVPLNTHAHGNWAFTKPGLYRLAVQMSGTTTAGKAVTDTRTLTIAVGDSTDPTSGFGPGSGSAGGGDNDGKEQGGAGRLPRTGTGWVLSAGAAGVVLVAAGAVLVMLTRRRRAGLADTETVNT
ncbi:TIGR03773 family transporter-associated surface protein [Micromonospora aurantiaca (nom. illeg.)]|uniref:TIGR03773 family transporter-associated surface protein n=1 Tax=Micromonospora aurantiaca (nom. illeg.) TaxID=47850 RepID=UPI0001BF1D88|nr:TIGR03773 family transporter-associated surface protein [Micromonospora aurantiaca]ADL47577.1 cell wall anchor domain-containing protein [Micromonospora aurantiaca ATCC 27029]